MNKGNKSVKKPSWVLACPLNSVSGPFMDGYGKFVAES